MTRKFYLFTVMTALFMLVAPSLRAQQSGACGDNLTWTLDADSVLTISGTGAMTDFPYNGSAPWGQSPRKVVIKNGVTTIGTYAFGSCASMTSIEIPNSVTSIGHHAFTYAGLTSVDIPNSVTSVGKGAFYYCGALTSINIPSSVTSFPDYVFSYCSGLKSVNIPNSVTSIGVNAFFNCTGLTSIDIPNSVISIGSSAFDGCTGLTSIDIPNSLTSIGEYAFANCSGLTSATIPSSVTKIDGYAFASCEGLKKIESKAEIPPVCGEMVFMGVGECVLYVPEKSIETYRSTAPWSDFSSIEALQAKVVASGNCGDNITWTLNDEGLLTIEGNGAMYSYYSVDNVAPWRELSVTSVVIGDGVTTIGDYAFYRKSDITSVTIPSSVTSIQQFAFCYCSGLTSVDISNSVTSIGSYAFYGTGLTSVTIPSSITEIVNSVFDSCTGLKSVIIPSTVTKIGGYAFYRCTSLEKIECLAVTPPACESTTFYETDKSKCELIVPKGSVEDYKTADQWKDFYSIVAGINGMSQDSKVTVSASNGVITVTGVAANTVVEVYSISGTLVYSGTASTVAVPSAGIYVVKAAGKTVKVNAAK